MNKKLTLLLFMVGSIATALMSTGCQTVQGAGQDIENAGEALEDAVN